MAELTSRQVQHKIAGLVLLSRWREHVVFTVPLTLLGINLALEHSHTSAGNVWRGVVVLLANTLAVTFAFMINEAEDAADDARAPERVQHNAVASGILTVREGWIAALVVGGLALLGYVMLGSVVLATGALTVVLALLYSWHRVRLKALPVVDVVSHALMLSALLFLAGYAAFARSLAESWLIALGVGLVSAYGQFYNQVRDYAADRAAGLHNTASFLGLRRTRLVMYACLGVALVCWLVAVGIGVWPLWTVGLCLVAMPVTALILPTRDLRGSPTVDLSGRLQTGFLIGANVVLVVWLGVLVL
ncbi:MAG: prenyltransferase [Chloroflexi bacterium]|nr:prenyltransferase [Chloroflexota bacterium]